MSKTQSQTENAPSIQILDDAKGKLSNQLDFSPHMHLKGTEAACENAGERSSSDRLNKSESLKRKLKSEIKVSDAHVVLAIVLILIAACRSHNWSDTSPRKPATTTASRA